MTQQASQIPRWFVLGRVALPGTLLLAVDQTYEQTLLTWSRGEQMVGFTVWHAFGPLMLLAFLSVIVGHLFLLGLCGLVVSRRLQHRQLPSIPWVSAIALLVGLCTLYIPYSVWKHATIALMGPGPHAAQFLVYAAHDGDRPTVELLLNHGVSVDALNGTSTALNGACAGGQIEIARFLLSKGADVSRARDCQELLPLLSR